MANTTPSALADATSTILPTELATNCSCSMNKTLILEEQASTLSFAGLLLFTVLSIMIFLLNAGVLFIVLSRRKLRSEASLAYCVSLSAADVTLALTYMFNMALLKLNIHMPILCTMAKNLLLVGGMLSAGSVALLVVHRYVSVRLPILHRKSHTLTVSVCLCVTMWIVCTLAQFLPYAMEKNKYAYEQCHSESSYWKELPSAVPQIAIIGYTLLGLISLLHMLTFLEVKRLYRKITPKVVRRRNKLTHKSKAGRSVTSQTFQTEVAYVSKLTDRSKCQDPHSSSKEGQKVKSQLPITTETSFEGDINPDSSIPRRDVEKNSSTNYESRERDITVLTGVSKTAKVTTFLIISMFVFNLPLLVLLTIVYFGNESILYAQEYAVLRRVISLLHFLNTLVHPIIYAGNQEQIRNYITKIVSRSNCRQA